MKTKTSLVLGLVLCSHIAHAQQMCAFIKSMFDGLHADYHESVVWMGNGKHGVQVYMTQATDGKTWSVLYTDPASGTACMLASGKQGQFVDTRKQK
jgi:glycerate kinase